MNVDEWVAMFQEIGLDEAKREQWHKLFETRHPAAHQAFLEWLGISPEDIAGPNLPRAILQTGLPTAPRIPTPASVGEGRGEEAVRIASNPFKQ